MLCARIFFLLTLSAYLTAALRTSLHRSTIKMAHSGPAQNVVILGAGIHGASVAYYLSTKFGIFPTIVERTGIAAAASGKAGGFLAREWGSGATRELHQVSFDMHETLGNKLLLLAVIRERLLRITCLLSFLNTSLYFFFSC